MIAAKRRMFVFHGERSEMAQECPGLLKSLSLRAGEALDKEPPGRVVSASATSVCRLVEVGDGTEVFVKIARYPIFRRIKTWCQPSKSVIEVFAYNHLASLGFSSLDTLALAERRWFGFLQASLIVTRGVPNSIDLLEFSRCVWPNLNVSEQKLAYRHISRRLIEQLRVAHAGSFVHHDLKWRNVLLQKEGANWHPLWIDSPRAAVWSKRRRQRISVVDLADLARMGVDYLSLYDRVRFLRDYLGPERQPGDVQKLFRLIAARVQRRIDRDANRAKSQGSCG